MASSGGLKFEIKLDQEQNESEFTTVIHVDKHTYRTCILGYQLASISRRGCSQLSCVYDILSVK